MDKQIKILLEKCLVLIKNGYSIRYCLSKYSKNKKELEDYLQAIAALKETIPVKLEKGYLESNLHKIYNKIENKTLKQKINIQYKKPLILRPAIIFLSVLVAVLFSFSGIIFASQSSIPGNSLYLVKRTIEDIKIKIYPESISKVLHYQILRSRIYEAVVLLKSSNSDDVIINDLINEIDLAFLQCKKYAYFGNRTEEEVLEIIQAIRQKLEERLGEFEEEVESDLDQIFKKEEIETEINNQDEAEAETEDPDDIKDNSELCIDKEDVGLDDRDYDNLENDSETDYEPDEENGVLEGDDESEEDSEPEEDDESEEDSEPGEDDESEEDSEPEEDDESEEDSEPEED